MVPGQPGANFQAAGAVPAAEPGADFPEEEGILPRTPGRTAFLWESLSASVKKPPSGGQDRKGGAKMEHPYYRAERKENQVWIFG